MKRKALQVCVFFSTQKKHTGSETETDTSLPARHIFGNILKGLFKSGGLEG